MRRAPIAALAVGALGAVLLVVLALTTSTTRAFTIGVLSSAPSPAIGAGHTACQKPIRVPPGGAFDAVDFEVGNYDSSDGPPIDVTVRPIEGTFPRRHGVLPGGYPDVGIQQRHVVKVGSVPDGALVAVCFHNRGPGPIALFGNGDAAAGLSSGFIDDAAIGFDFDVVLRTEKRSFASLIGDLAGRASLFRPPWLAPGVFYALFALLLLGLPALLARAVRDLGR
ncbi:MAG: hypothetical protein JWM73_1904 [Solirubrobacterales bacterium]|jgi:hypothetical protein|nr:hypothetical protein [Solirubrobacterales bacterium]